MPSDTFSSMTPLKLHACGSPLSKIRPRVVSLIFFQRTSSLLHRRIGCWIVTWNSDVQHLINLCTTAVAVNEQDNPISIWKNKSAVFRFCRSQQSQALNYEGTHMSPSTWFFRGQLNPESYLPLGQANIFTDWIKICIFESSHPL